MKSNPIIENTKNGFGLTPLHYAASHGNFLLCQFIIHNISVKNPRNRGGLTPFHIAAFNGHLSVCELLINNITDKNPHVSGIFQGTPLHFAAQKGHYWICKFILEHAAIKNPMDDPMLLRMGMIQFVSSWWNTSRITISRAAFGKTPFHLASQKGHLEVC